MPQKSRQDVKADRHRFECDELHDQVEALDHEHHADRGEKNQRVVFAVVLVLDIEILHGEQDHHRGRGQKNHAEEEREIVDHQARRQARRVGKAHLIAAHGNGLMELPHRRSR